MRRGAAAGATASAATSSDARYTIRFTPRRDGSSWSAINIGRVRAHRGGAQGAAGRQAFIARRAALIRR